MTDIDQLVAALPPPGQGVEPVQWAEFESRFGRRLPDDYKAFVDAYGLGRFSEFLTVFVPSSSYGFAELETQREIVGGKIELWLDFDEIGSPSLPVDPHQLLPVAGTDNGNTAYWNMRGSDDPERWTIVVDEARSDGWHLTDDGIVAFLTAVFVDRVRIPVFPESIYLRPATFRSVL